MTTEILNKDTNRPACPDFWDELSEEVKCISYMLSAIGDSVSSTGLPSDPAVFGCTLMRLSNRLDLLGEVFDEIYNDLIEDPEGEEDD